MDLEEIVVGGRDDRISEIFYYFEQLTSLASGRTVGRKIGVLQETVLRKYLEKSDAVKRRLYLEQPLVGISGAAHKVEFSWYSILDTTTAVGEEIEGTHGLLVTAINELSGSIRVQTPQGQTLVLAVNVATPRSGGVRLHLDAHHIDLRIREVGDDYVQIDVVDKSRLLASLESKRVGAQRFSGSDKLGSGIQTIEKAKQASLVAIDLDLAYNGSVKPLQDATEQKQLLSLVALGNGVHWTQKDKAVLGTFVDFTFLVKDQSIIRYVEYVRELAGENVDFLDFFMDYFQGMTKQAPDDFEVLDDDFSIIVPEAEERSLLAVIEGHLTAVDHQG